MNLNFPVKMLHQEVKTPLGEICSTMGGAQVKRKAGPDDALAVAAAPNVKITAISEASTGLLMGGTTPQDQDQDLLASMLGKEEIRVARDSYAGDVDPEEATEKEKRKDKRKKRLLKEAEKADRRGVCYLSRVPPHMDPLKLRQILSQFGEIQRLYLTPENPAAQVRRKKSGGFRGQEFSEGWVEFTDKKVAKRVARMLNGEQIGGRKRSSFYYDLWNIKYLSKFKWDDLTEEIAYKIANREQKLAMELSAAKRERDFYLSKVDQSKALIKIEERLKKKQNVEMVPKVVRHFPQKKPAVNGMGENKAQLSRDILAGVFGCSS